MLEDAPPTGLHGALRVTLAATPRRMASLPTLAADIAAVVQGGCQVTCSTLADAAHGMAEGSEALVMVLDPLDDTRGLTAALDQADRAGVPHLLVTERRSAQGMGLTAVPLEAGAQGIGDTLRGMLSRQPELARLRAQASGAQAMVGGLRGDLARMHDELQLAAQVQREFLPKSLPELPRAQVAAMWRPASWVSGDIYDVRRLDEHHLGLFIADAVGHGVPAALMTMVIARCLPTKQITGSSYRLVPPAEALAVVNRELLARDGRATRFATAVYGVLDLRTLRMRIACAGHPAPVVLRGHDHLEFIRGKGGVLGVFEDEGWEETQVDLQPGDRLVLHSDGFEAAFPEDQAARLKAPEASPMHVQAFQQVLGVDEPSDIVKRLGERVDRARMASANADDVTLVVLRAG